MRGNHPFIAWLLTTSISHFPILCFWCVRQEVPKIACFRCAVICEGELNLAVTISITVFLDVTPCRLLDTNRRLAKSSVLPLTFYHEEGRSMLLRNVDKHMCHYTASHPRKSQPSTIFMRLSSVLCVLHVSPISLLCNVNQQQAHFSN
jgi:hypothetical protein